MTTQSVLHGKTALITGASRGIGRSIALTLAREGVRVVLGAKSVTPQEKLAGTLGEVMEEIHEQGGQALAVQTDVRDERQVANLVDEAVTQFGGLDIVINNAGAIALSGIEKTPLKQFDLMWQINTRAAFLTSQLALPHLKQSKRAHVVLLSPPISLNPSWFAQYAPYSITKYAMSLLTIGLAEEFKKHHILVNSIWPKTIIATAAIERHMGGKSAFDVARKPQIVADAVLQLLLHRNASLSGKALTDEDCLGASGITNFDKYAFNLKKKLMKDLFIDPPPTR